MSDPGDTFNVSHELRELVDAYTNEAIDDIGFSRLQELLAGDSAARAFFRRAMNLDAALRDYGDSAGGVWELCDQALLQSDSNDLSNDAPKRATFETRKRTGRQRLDRLGWPTAVAAITVALALLAWIVAERVTDRTVGGDSGGQVVMEDDPTAEPTDNGIAVLTHATLARFGADGIQPEVGRTLPAGRLQVVEGSVCIEFYSGAQVVLSGPADFELISTNKSRCRYGDIRAVVPPQARGFTVVSPQMEIIDLGTEFGLSVSEDGGAEVHVFEGKVEFQELASGDEHTSRRDLNGGDAVRIDASGTVETVMVDPARFVTSRQVVQRAAAEAGRRYEAWQAEREELASDSRLLLYYRFEDAERGKRTLLNCAVDRSPSSHGAIVGCDWSEGHWPGKAALEFKGPGDRVRFHVDGECSSLTLAAWVRIDGLDRRFNSLMLSDRFDTGAVHWQIHEAGGLMLGIKGDEQSYSYLSPPVFQPGKLGRWTHVCTVYDHLAREVRQFADGEQVSNEPLQFDTPLRIESAELGNWGLPRAGDRYPIRSLNGRIDEFVVFSAALNVSEVERLHRHGAPFVTHTED